MKTIKNLLKLFIICLFANQTFAQVQPVSEILTNPNSYWQLSSRVGYDSPMYKEDFKYIDYKGGIMAGLSVNRYWNRWGFQTDFDYIKNTPVADFPSPTNYLEPGTMGPTLVPLTLSTTKKDITRMFFGIGPAYKYQSPNNKFTTEFAVLGGLGIINGGEILVEGSYIPFGTTPRTVPLTYHSGFDKEKVFTMKGQLRFNYFFNDNWGVNAGAYYMNHFDVKESTKNQILVDKGYPSATTPLVYYFEQGTIDIPTQNSEGDIVLSGFNLDSKSTILRNNEKEIDQRQSLNLQSVGVFAGITYKFAPRKKREPKVVEEKIKEEPKTEKYCVQVTAKDKFTKEILPNTDVALKNSTGEVVGTAKTDAFGVVKFCDQLANDYTVSGIFNEVALEGNTIKKAEFVNGKTILKEIDYADRNFIVKGRAFECNTTTPIAGINVVLENKDLAVKKSTVTDAQGNFMLNLPETGTYELYGRKEDYFSQIEQVSASDYQRDKNLFVKLEMCAEKADCGKGLGLKNILFDLDKYVIKDAAKPELNRLVRFMIDNPTVKVEVGSHTDCRSSHAYNKKLSQNRANASVDYVVSQGIDRSRISGKGYGETQLLNRCADGVNCSEDEYAINRRTEMKVICPQ